MFFYIKESNFTHKFWCQGLGVIHPFPQNLNLKVPITSAANDIFFFFFFQRKQVLTFHVNHLLGRWFTWNVKTWFLWKIKKKKFECRLLQILLGTLRVKLYVGDRKEIIKGYVQFGDILSRAELGFQQDLNLGCHDPKSEALTTWPPEHF